MGSFYANVTVKTSDADAVVALVETWGGPAAVIPANGDCLVLHDCLMRDPEAGLDLTRQLSSIAPTILVAVADSDALWYWAFRDGQQIGAYASAPGYPSEIAKSSIENLEAVAAAFGTDATGLAEQLEVDPDDGQLPFTFVEELHEAICERLGLPLAAVRLEFEDVLEYLPEGIDPSAVRRVAGEKEVAAAPWLPRMEAVFDRPTVAQVIHLDVERDRLVAHISIGILGRPPGPISVDPGVAAVLVSAVPEFAIEILGQQYHEDGAWHFSEAQVAIIPSPRRGGVPLGIEIGGTLVGLPLLQATIDALRP